MAETQYAFTAHDQVLGPITIAGGFQLAVSGKPSLTGMVMVERDCGAAGWVTAGEVAVGDMEPGNEASSASYRFRCFAPGGGTIDIKADLTTV